MSSLPQTLLRRLFWVKRAIRARKTRIYGISGKLSSSELIINLAVVSLLDQREKSR